MITIIKLNQLSDERGWLVELFRNDSEYKPAMAYLSFTNPGFIRGPHEHRYQTDFFYFIGNFELHLWDNRNYSDNLLYGTKQVIITQSDQAYIVPPGVVHGYKSISGGFVFNTPDKLYKGVNKQEEVDEIRHEKDPNSKFLIE